MVFYLFIFREQHDGQNPSRVTRGHLTLDKTGCPKKHTNKRELFAATCDREFS